MGRHGWVIGKGTGMGRQGWFIGKGMGRQDWFTSRGYGDGETGLVYWLGYVYKEAGLSHW